MTEHFPGRPDTRSLRIRRAVRAILLTPDGYVLLVRFEFPRGTVWALPGGGLDGDETHVDALHRELAEEVGLRGAVIGPYVWDRLHVIPIGDGTWDGQTDRYHLVEVHERFDPTPDMTWEQLRAESLHELRWWHLDEIAADTDRRFAPGRLAELLRELIAHGPPPRPVDTGI
ncbi:MAG: NUDIX domain-containing protein [Ilumatobacter sp.]